MAKRCAEEEVGWTSNAGLVDVHMHRVAYLATAAVFAAVPVSFGLIGNTSFSEHVQVRVPPRATLPDVDGAAAPQHRVGQDPDAERTRRNPEAARTSTSTKNTHTHQDGAPAEASGAKPGRGEADRKEPAATSHVNGTDGGSQVVTTDDHERVEVRSTRQGPRGGDDSGTGPSTRSGSGSGGGSGGSSGSGSGGSSGSGSGGHSGGGSSSGSGSGSGGSGSGGSGSGGSGSGGSGSGGSGSGGSGSGSG